MDTINGKPIHEFVDQSERQEIRATRKLGISETHKSLYGKSDKLRLGSYFDKDQRSGKVKHYTKKEIAHMVTFDSLHPDTRSVLEFLLNTGPELPKDKVVLLFKKSIYWRGHTSNGIKSDLDYLVGEGLVERISRTGEGNWIPYKRGTRAYYRATHPDQFEKPTPAGEEKQVPAKPEQEDTYCIDPPVAEKEPSLTFTNDDWYHKKGFRGDLKDILSEWMDFHDVEELSIHIKKRN
jgi:hypothetical protein